MSRVRVPIYNTPAKSAVLDTAATIGATIGANVWNPDGSLFAPAAAATPAAGNEVAVTVWRRVMEIPPNIVSLAALTGKGHPYRETSGSWRLRKSGRAVIDFTFGDATPAPIYTLTENAANVLLRVVIRTPFNGVGAALSLVAASGPTLLASSDIAPSVAGGYEAAPDAILLAGDVIQLVITPGTGATAGAGFIVVDTIHATEH